MIESYKHRGLKELYETGTSRKVAPALQGRIRVRLSAMNAAANPKQLDQPGFNFHSRRGKPQRYTIHVNGPWRLAFGWDDGATDVDLEQYH